VSRAAGARSSLARTVATATDPRPDARTAAAVARTETTTAVADPGSGIRSHFPNRAAGRIVDARAEKVAFTDEELELGMRSMATPVEDAQGNTRAA
jgi:DNA-binding IclR family transcriptional regulator